MTTRRGRPPKAEGPRTRIEIYIEKDEKEILEAAAKEDHRSLSSWARAVLLRAAGQ